MSSFSSAVFIGSMRLLSKLPFATAQSLGHRIGQQLLRFDKRTVTAIDRNLALCFPNWSPSQRRQVRQKRLGYMGQTLFEMSHLWVRSATQIRDYIVTADNATFEQALQSEGGVIILAPHLGNWEMLNYYVSTFRTMTVMYRPQKDAALDEFILNARRRVGSELAPTNRKGVMQLMKTLKDNGLVGILPDQVPQPGSGVYAPFFGLPAYTMTLARQLAQKTQANVFVGAAFQVNGGYDIRVIPLATSFYDADELVSLTAMNQAIEALIHHQPEQYQWEYKRFKHPPEGTASFYAND